MIKYLLRLGEISLKKNNRAFFEKQLKKNLKAKFKPYHSIINSIKGRMYLDIDEDCPEDLIKKALDSTFGIVAYARCLYTKDKSLKSISNLTKLLIEKEIQRDNFTFKIELKKSDVNYKIPTYDSICYVADEILDLYPKVKVDVKNYEYLIKIEIRDQIYVYTNDRKGLAGLPVYSAGRALLLLSGGLDSPVAGYRMASRGLSLDCIYFHSFPYTSDKAKEKVIELAKILSRYSGGTHLYIINFTKVLEEMGKALAKNSWTNEYTITMRMAMIKASLIIAKEFSFSQSLVTGEALSQVASQTIESLSVTNSCSNIPIFRPLIGMDKEEIILTSKRAGFYETSILPFDDCCTLFSPKNPKIRPNVDELNEHYKELGIDDLVKKSAEEAQVIFLSANSSL